MANSRRRRSQPTSPLEAAREIRVIEQHVGRIVGIAVTQALTVIALELALLADALLAQVRALAALIRIHC